MLLLTVANLATVVLLRSETVFVFSAAIPEIALSFAMGNYFAPQGKLFIIILASVALAAVLVLYFLCWLLCKKKTVWLTVALVAFVADFIARLILLGIAFSQANAPGHDIDLLPTVIGFAVAAWILYYLVQGVNAAKQLKRLKTWNNEE